MFVSMVVTVDDVSFCDQITWAGKARANKIYLYTADQPNRESMSNQSPRSAHS